MEPNKTSSNPFFKTVNSGYGENWQASQGQHPMLLNETPDYKDLVPTFQLITYLGRKRPSFKEFNEDVQARSPQRNERKRRIRCPYL